MKIFKSISEIRNFVGKLKAKGRQIGLAPTMGALHEGHLTLIHSSNQRCDITIASIFVNPAQFNNKEDLEKYPVSIDQDLEKLKEAGCGAVFLPETHEIYPFETTIQIDFGILSSQLEGKFRPGHFNGVGLVVSKLFNIIRPHCAFFGQKDLQQFFIIKSLRDQLNFPIELVMVPTVREPNGLAMSSRNLRLNQEEKEEAALLLSSLMQAQKVLLSGKSVNQAKAEVQELFSSSKRLALEYFEVIHTSDFKPIEQIRDKENTAMCIAAEIGEVRLIDNLMLIS